MPAKSESYKMFIISSTIVTVVYIIPTCADLHGAVLEAVGVEGGEEVEVDPVEEAGQPGVRPVVLQ